MLTEIPIHYPEVKSSGGSYKWLSMVNDVGAQLDVLVGGIMRDTYNMMRVVETHPESQIVYELTKLGGDTVADGDFLRIWETKDLSRDDIDRLMNAETKNVKDVVQAEPTSEINLRDDEAKHMFDVALTRFKGAILSPLVGGSDLDNRAKFEIYYQEHDLTYQWAFIQRLFAENTLS